MPRPECVCRLEGVPEIDGGETLPELCRAELLSAGLAHARYEGRIGRDRARGPRREAAGR